MKKRSILKNALLIILIIVLIVLIVFLLKYTYTHINKSVVLNNKEVIEIKETIKKNIKSLLISDNNTYILKDLIDEKIIIDDEYIYDTNKSKILLTKRDNDSYLIEIYLYTDNSYNYIKEEVSSSDMCSENNENETKKPEYEYKKTTTENQFDHYECESGYSLEKNVCVKISTETKTSDAEPIYEDLITTVAASSMVTNKLICKDGYDLEENNCIRKAYIASSNKLTCNQDFYKSEANCTKPVENNKINVYYCDNGILKDNKCITNPILKETEIIVKSTSNYELVDKQYKNKYDYIDCSTDYCKLLSKYEYEDTIKTEEEFCEDGNLENNICVVDAKQKEIKKYDCIYNWSGKLCENEGFNQIGKICNEQPNITEEIQMKCTEGILKDNTCISVPEEKEQVTYNCEIGTLTGTNCVIKKSEIVSYKCSGDSLLNGIKCETQIETISAKAPIAISKEIKTYEYMWSENELEIGWEKTGNKR